MRADLRHDEMRCSSTMAHSSIRSWNEARCSAWKEVDVLEIVSATAPSTSCIVTHRALLGSVLSRCCAISTARLYSSMASIRSTLDEPSASRSLSLIPAEIQCSPSIS